jgi:hypothetical protein
LIDTGRAGETGRYSVCGAAVWAMGCVTGSHDFESGRETSTGGAAFETMTLKTAIA